jgi:hypothetical protein
MAEGDSGSLPQHGKAVDRSCSGRASRRWLRRWLSLLQVGRAGGSVARCGFVSLVR